MNLMMMIKQATEEQQQSLSNATVLKYQFLWFNASQMCDIFWHKSIGKLIEVQYSYIPRKVNLFDLRWFLFRSHISQLVCQCFNGLKSPLHSENLVLLLDLWIHNIRIIILFGVCIMEYIIGMSLWSLWFVNNSWYWILLNKWQKKLQNVVLK